MDPCADSHQFGRSWPRLASVWWLWCVPAALVALGALELGAPRVASLAGLVPLVFVIARVRGGMVWWGGARCRRCGYELTLR